LQHHKLNETLKNLEKIVPDHLPEATIVEYLLSVKSLQLEDLRDYLIKYNQIPFIQFYNGNYIDLFINVFIFKMWV
jgi:hypothetical protein